MRHRGLRHQHGGAPAARPPILSNPAGSTDPQAGVHHSPTSEGREFLGRAEGKVDKTALCVGLLHEEPFSADGGGFLNPLGGEAVEARLTGHLTVSGWPDGCGGSAQDGDFVVRLAPCLG